MCLNITTDWLAPESVKIKDIEYIKAFRFMRVRNYTLYPHFKTLLGDSRNHMYRFECHEIGLITQPNDQIQEVTYHFKFGKSLTIQNLLGYHSIHKIKGLVLEWRGGVVVFPVIIPISSVQSLDFDTVVSRNFILLDSKILQEGGIFKDYQLTKSGLNYYSLVYQTLEKEIVDVPKYEF